MSRGIKPTKGKAKAKRSVARTPRKKADTSVRVRQLEERLSEARAQQAAASDVLRVIASSPTDIQPVFELIAERAMRLCGALHGGVLRFDGELIHLAAHAHASPAFVDALQRIYPMRPGRSTAGARAILTRAVVHVPDIAADLEYEIRSTARAAGFRSTVAVPMLQDDRALGAIVVLGDSATSFSPQQIELLRTFADQAVIAIENVRLFQESDARNRALAEALEQQTATSEVLRVISSSPTDIQPVLDTVAESAARLCESIDAIIFLRDSDGLRPAAHHGPISLGAMREVGLPLVRGTAPGRAVLDGRTVHIADMQKEIDEFPESSENARRMGFRTNLCVPLVREGETIGTIALRRNEVRPFTERQVALLKTFADQAVIAIENVRLFKELAARNADLTDSLEQQTATSEILRVISGSHVDVEPVFEVIVRSAVRLLGGLSGLVTRVADDQLHLAAITSTDRSGDEAQQATWPRPLRGPTLHNQVIERLAPCACPDMESDPSRTPSEVAVARSRGFRSLLVVPLLRDGRALGTLGVTRCAAGPFSDGEVALLQTFADQAVIAIENVRLFTQLEARNRDLTETLEQQTATGEVLRVISSSPTDIQPVLDTVAESAARLCDAFDAAIWLRESDRLRIAAHHGSIPAQPTLPLIRGTSNGRAILDGRTVHIADMQAEAGEFPEGATNARRMGHRTILCVPLMREGVAIGTLQLRRRETRLFTERQVALLETFADQAVIAIENARLFTELEARNRDLTETLEQQTATGEILRVISGSPTDVQPVFDTIAQSAARLCDGELCFVFRFEDGLLHFVAHHGLTPDRAQVVGSSWPAAPDRGSAVGRAVLDGRAAHIADALEDPEYRLGAVATAASFRSMVAVPMEREGLPIGAISVLRSQPGPFSTRQIELLKTFADQAVIAVENVRLFDELEARNRDLAVSLEQQTATSEVLKVISRSAFDLEPVLENVIESATRLCGATRGHIFRFDGDMLRFAAAYGAWPGFTDYLEKNPVRPGAGSVAGRAAFERRTLHVPDVRQEPEYQYGELLNQQDYRAVLAVPMLREDVLLGVIVILKSTVEPFSDKQIELVTTFADQAVIAIENVRLFKELEARNHELTDTLEQQTATSEVLKVISRSAFDLQPVFDTLTENVVRLCDAERAFLFRFDGDFLRAAAWYNASPEIVEAVQRNPMSPGRHSSAARAALDRRTVHIPDIQADPEYAYSPARADGVRTVLSVPMLKGDALVGVLTIFKLEVRPFTDKQVALVETFADQAVIAIENVRLFQELEAKNHDLTQTLEQQTATSEILRVISSSPTDVQPVFDTIVASAVRLCAARMGAVYRFDDELVHLVAHHNYSPEVLAVLQQMHPRPPQIDQASGRAILTRAVAQIEDTLADPQYPREVALVPGGFRSVLAVPMLRDGAPIGAIVITRSEAGPFPDGHIELVKTFAAQAVIAVENVWLFTELEARNSELKVSLEQQTATSELLKVIGRSTFDLEPVFEALAESAVRLCEAERGVILRFDGQVLRFAVGHNVSPELRAFFEQNPIPPGRHTNAGRAALTRRTVHNHDVLSDPEYRYGGSQVDPYRTVLSIPMLRGDELLGVIVIYRHEVRPFTDNQVALMETFADQAAIAIENVRLFHELETRNRDLSEALAQQTATSEVLKVISRSTFDLEPVLQTLIENAARLCHAEGGVIYKSDGDLHRLAAAYNISQEFRDFVAQNPLGPGAGTAVGRAMLEGRTIHIHDVREDPTYTYSGVSLGGYRTILGVPMLREGLPIGVFSVWRTQVLPFTDRQIELVTSFADQGAIAIENVRLFQELEARTRELTRSVDELRALGEVSQAVGSTLDLEAVLVTIVSRAVQLSGSDQGIVYEFDEATQTFHQRATHQVSGEYLEAVRSAPIRLGEGAIGRAGVTREPVQIADLQADLQLVAPQVRAYLTHEGMRSLLAIPLIQEERLLGGLVILRREQGAFSPEVVATLRTFATQSVLAINNARLFREIQRQKQYSDALVETSPVAIVTLDLHGMVMGWNPGAERLFGYTQDEVMGRELAELVATPEMREEVRTAIRTTLEGERFRAITRRARKDGTLVDVDTSAKFVVVDGVQVGLIAIYHDITELLQARREAEAANEAKSAFLATMSHEIRTPMNAVIGMSGLLLNTDLSDEQREYAEVVRQSGDALLTVINDILDFSKIEAGKLELESQPFDLRECLESALDLVATRAAEKGLDLAYLFGDGTPAAIVGDVTRLRQILLNLLSNAVKFTESGEVVLSVSATRLDAHAPLYEMTFIVRDTGIGIPPERLDRLFQSFSQVDASTTRRYGGTGLGLAISQRLTELMGGRISVTSEVGVGSEFRFTVRAAASLVPVPTRRDLSGVQPSLRGKRVLVVDDNATNRRILTTYLDAWGMQARATESPREALEWIRADAGFDIGILDMHMPEMDGVALARAIREHRPGDMLPLILFTSLGRRESRADSEGFAAYLHKPIKPSQLFDALVSVLAEQPVHVQARGTARTDLDPRMAERHPLRILLAEDNVVNQKVAIRLLGQMGYRADVAGNGLEAIEAIERQTYDVVLMDVQMPELDGFGASREINRRWPGERHPRIVAMTANAMQGDRELCEAAGMDDYVAKPIRVEELVAALLRCRLRSDTATRSEPTTAAATTGAPAPQDAGGGATSIDAAVIDGLTATMGSPFIAELIGTFGEDAQELIATLRQALSGADLDMFRRAAHSLKSTSETLGATRLATMARELEAMARAGTIDGTADRVERLAAEYQIVADLLGEVRRDLPA